MVSKPNLYKLCQEYLNKRLISLTNSIKSIQQSANEDTKSSAGDKYETGRAMAHLEIEKYQQQLNEAMKMIADLMRISPDESSNVIKTGSLVFTSRGNFYIAVNVGQQTLDGQTFFTVSTASPIAQKLIGLQADDTFMLNNQEFRILSVQ